MNVKINRLVFAVYGYFMVLSWKVIDANNGIAIHDLIFYSSGLGFNLTELIQRPSFPTRTKTIPCNGSMEFDPCMDILRTSLSREETYHIKNVVKTCHFQNGTFGCARHFISGNSSLKEWSHFVKKTMNSFCSQRCWERSHYVQSLTCNLTSDTSVDKVSEKQVSFVTQIFNTICTKQANEICVDSLDKYLTKATSQTKYCNVTSGLTCTSTECQEEVSVVKETTNCCMLSVAGVLQKYNISGTPVQNMIQTCGLRKDEKCQKTNTPTASSSTQPAKKGGISGRLVAGIIISIIISGVGLFLMARCLYRIVKKKKSAKYEDYGYSQLRMMEESLYNDVEESDDDLLEI